MGEGREGGERGSKRKRRGGGVRRGELVCCKVLEIAAGVGVVFRIIYLYVGVWDVRVCVAGACGMRDCCDIKSWFAMLGEGKGSN